MELVKMETARHDEDEKTRILYDASYKGNVLILNSLTKQDPLILHKICSRTPFVETPLHISALLGHLEFTKALLALKPTLAHELDSFQGTALHLASAEGRIDIVKELLLAFDQACLVRDQEGRIPLHYAVIRRRLEVVIELIRAKPETRGILDKGKTIFHLCVTYNHLEILKALVELNIGSNDLPHLKDQDEKTVLDLAIRLKQVETVRYLLSIPNIRGAACLENEMDVVTDDLKDFKTFQIQLMLMKSGIKFTEKSQMVRPPQPPPSKTTSEKGWRKILGMIMEQNNSNWLEEMRGNLSLVATMISTISFQAMINPPGGFVQQGILSDNEDPFGCLSENGYRTCPGDSVSAITFEDYLHPYMKYNTVCFIGSLSVALLLVSGVPLKHKAVIWMLSIGMCITLTFLSLTYLQGLYVVTPSGKLFDSARRMFHVSLMCWIGFLGVVAVFITLRFLYWLVKNEKKTSDINSSKDNGIRKYMKSNVCLHLFF